jgi:endo-1,4-beta-xylanase
LPAEQKVVGSSKKKQCHHERLTAFRLPGMVVAFHGRIPTMVCLSALARSRRSVVGVTLSYLLALGCSTVPERRPSSNDGGQSANGAAGDNGLGGNDGVGGEDAHDVAGRAAGGEQVGGEPSGGSPGTGGSSISDDVLRARTSPSKPGVACVGTALNPGMLDSDQAYRAIAGSEFNCAVAEYGMKWDSMEPKRGTFDFSLGDQVVAFARQHDMRLKGHALVWHGATPDWVLGVSSPEALRTVIRDYVTAVVTHFKGEVEAWDVVNEAISDSGGTFRNTHFYKVLGADLFRVAFEAARAADPDVKLLYNDYGGEGLGVKSDAIYALVKSLKESGVPIDGIGLQSHLTHTGVPPKQLADNMKRLAALGLSINLSEIDVRMGMAQGTQDEKLARQAEIYRQLAAACANEPACTGLFVWGFTDAHSWVDGTFGGTNLPCLLDENLTRKPAYEGFRAGMTDVNR